MLYNLPDIIDLQTAKQLFKGNYDLPNQLNQLPDIIDMRTARQIFQNYSMISPTQFQIQTQAPIQKQDRPKVQINQDYLKDISRQIVRSLGSQTFGEQEIPALERLVIKESGFNPTAQNPTSSAFGLFQFLDSTRKNYGITKTSDPTIQTKAGLEYIKNRYGTPSKALQFHLKNNWY